MAFTDLRYAFRLLRLRPGSSAAIVLTLAVAIGANSTLFTLVNAALFSPLPVADPERLVNIYTTREDGTGYGGLSYPDYLDLRSANPALADALGYSGLMTTVTDEGSSEVIFGELVTANYFSLLGITPALGRGFLPVEGVQRGGDPVVVVGDGFWRRRFNADPSVVGRTIPLNGRPFTIVGVAPRGFPGLLFRALSADVWVPVSMMGALRTDHLDDRSERWMFVKGRLKPESTVAEAAAAADVVSRRLQAVHIDSNKGRIFRVLASSAVIVHPDGDRAVFAASAGVMAAGLLVMIVACANLAGVMLARGLSRRREIAIRLSIGAGRATIVRQLLIECALLACLGGIGGMIVASWLSSALASWRPDLPVPVSLNTTIDSRVGIFTFALTAAATILFALLPALRASRTAPAGSMSATGSPGRSRLFKLRDAVLVPQLAIAIPLVGVASLFARSLSRADAVDPGFAIDRTAYVALNLAMNGYDEERARGFYERLSATLENHGAIRAAAVTSRVPLDLYGNQSASIVIGDAHRSVQAAQVGAGYFDAMGIALQQGRDFDPSDEQPGAEPVVIVSATAARAWWPGSDALGQALRMEDSNRSARVVGVVSDVRVQSLGESPQPFLYRPLATGHAGLLRLVVRSSSGNSATTVIELRRAVRALDPAVGVFEAKTMREHLEVMLYPYRLLAAVGTAFGLMAVVLAAIGLYGVLACTVSERLRDLAIRVALGAPFRSLVRVVSREAARAVLLAAVIGVVLALVCGRLLAEVLFGVSPYDPVSLSGTAVVLVSVVVLASAGPLRRASRAEVNLLLRADE